MEALKQAAIYCRVSTAGQEEEGTSLATQEARCRQYAIEHGYVVDEVHVYREVHTGTELWERPQLTMLRAAMRAGAVGVIIAYAIDRLSRDPVHLGVVLSEAEYVGVVVQFVTEPFDNSPEGQLIRFVRGYAAKVEHEKIRERSIRGKRARAESGKLLPGCRPLYGYRYTADRGAYQPDPVTAPIVRRIFADLAGGITLRALAAALTAEGIPTPSGKGAGYWQPSTIRWIATNPTYTGQAAAWRYATVRDRQRGAATVRLRPESEQVALPTGIVPLLVEAATFAAVQERLRLNKERAARNNHTPESALLRAGFLRCGYCGRAMSAESSPHGTIYKCSGQTLGAGRCNHGMLAHRLDGLVWARVEAILTDPELIIRQVANLRDDDPTAADVAAVDRMLRDLERQQRNLAHLAATVNDPDTAEPLVAHLRTLAQRKRQLEGERDNLLTRHEVWAAAQAQLDNLTA